MHPFAPEIAQPQCARGSVDDTEGSYSFGVAGTPLLCPAENAFRPGKFLQSPEQSLLLATHNQPPSKFPSVRPNSLASQNSPYLVKEPQFVPIFGPQPRAASGLAPVFFPHIHTVNTPTREKGVVTEKWDAYREKKTRS